MAACGGRQPFPLPFPLLEFRLFTLLSLQSQYTLNALSDFL